MIQSNAIFKKREVGRPDLETLDEIRHLHQDRRASMKLERFAMSESIDFGLRIGFVIRLAFRGPLPFARLRQSRSNGSRRGRGRREDFVS